MDALYTFNIVCEGWASVITRQKLNSVFLVELCYIKGKENLFVFLSLAALGFMDFTEFSNQLTQPMSGTKGL